METGSLRISDIRPDFIYMMEQAVKAPSGHNTQPWLFRVQKDRIQILPDMSKSLPAVDPDNRELFISLGCATENLCIAAEAKGYTPLPFFSGSGEITVLLSEASMIKETSGLIEEISVRQTNRGIYSGGNDSIGSTELFEEYAFGGKYQSAFVVERRVGVRYAFFLYICGE